MARLTLSILITLTLVAPTWAGDNFQQTLQCAERYDKAVAKGDLQQTLRAQNDALKLWNKLTSEEKRRLERESPGMYNWLQAGGDYQDAAVLRRNTAAARRR